MPKEMTEFNNLPHDIQREIFSYIDTPSMCFFAVSSKKHLRNARAVLVARQTTLLSALKITAGHDYSMCSIHQALYACGYNVYGQLGLGHANTFTGGTFTQVKTLPGRVQQVVTGGYHTLVLTKDNQLWVCGSNRDGQLGLEPRINHTTLTRVKALPGRIQQIVAGYDHTLVLTDQGLYVCGSNKDGQLGLGNRIKCTTTLTQVKALPSRIQQVVAGGYHTLVLTDQGLYVCGNNKDGQLGLGHENNCTTWTRVKDLPSRIQQIVAGRNHTLVLTDQGLYACGFNRFGQLGLGHKYNCTTLTRVKALPGRIQQVVAGGFNTWVLTDQGLYVCGSNHYGQLGLGHRNQQWYGSYDTTLTRVKALPGHIQQIVAGYGHTLILTDLGLYACGSNHHGQLGLGHMNNCVTLTPVSLPLEIKRLLSLYRHVEQLKIIDQGKTHVEQPQSCECKIM